MKAYIEGKLSEDNSKVNFILGDLWLADNPDYDDLEVDCVRLHGIWVEFSSEGKETCGRWKGIEYEFFDGESADEELNSLTRLKSLIGNKYIVNGEAFFDDDVDFEITSLVFVQGDEKWEFPKERICDTIEFIVWK